MAVRLESMPNIFGSIKRLLFNFEKTVRTRFKYESILYRDIVKFGSVGAVATTIDFSLLNLSLAFLDGENQIYIATFIGFIFGATVGYILNNAWTYRRLSRKPRPKYLMKYVIIGSFGLLITEAIMHHFAVYQDMNHNLAKLIAVGIVFFWNFSANRYWTFNAKIH